MCRAVTDAEVADLGLDPQQPAARLEAKKISSYRRSPRAIEIFQTISLSMATPNLRTRPEVVADTILAVAHSASVAVLTLHWWDFAGDGSEEFTERVADILARLRTDPAVTFAGIAAFAASATLAADRAQSKQPSANTTVATAETGPPK